MERRIHISDVDNSPAVCFDTGLDPRSFARTKMSQSLVEPGYIVTPDGNHEEWKTSGVYETNGFMRVWGPYFPGKRLDLLLDEIDSSVTDSFLTQQTVLRAIISWIKAKMFLGDLDSILNPGAVFVNNNIVFFAPKHLSNRCLFLERTEFEGTGVEGIERDRYNCPYLFGMDAIAFCAGVMLYKTLIKSHPYPSKDIYQDMKEGVFLPVHLAAPELNTELSDLIQSALLLPVSKDKKSSAQQKKDNGINILSGMLELLQKLSEETNTINVPMLFSAPTEEKLAQADKEKKSYLLRQNSAVKTRRFVTRNKNALGISAIGLLILLMIIISTARNVAQRPTTEGMTPDAVVFAYYEAFNNLDHTFMEACINGASKNDVNAAASLFAISRVRMAHEMLPDPIFIPANEWIEQGGELPAPNVFGVTNLTVEHIAGDEHGGMVRFRANYLLWPAYEEEPIRRTDVLTLRPDRKNNWRITEIQRTES